MGIEVKIKKWGNSIGVVIPSEVAEKMGLKPEQYAEITIQKKNKVLRDMFGAMKFKKPTEQILKEVRKDFESKWDK